MINFADLRRRDAPLNAFLTWAENAVFGEGPLAGKTIGVKANIMVRGLPWHAGLGALAGRIAERDAEVVTRLRAAGAAIIGILNMEEGALGAKTDNPFFGSTHNPHRAGYSPGGSSGGSGAAVAAGLCDAALGTDTMGSVRIPAAHCGVYGFKPANGRVSQDGLEPADPSLDVIGPLARDLTMLEAVARTISDFGEAACTGPGATLANHGVALHPAVSSAFERAVHALDRPPEHRLRFPNSRIRFAGFIQVSNAMTESLAGISASDHLAKLLAYGPRRSPEDGREDRAILAETASAVRSIIDQAGFLLMPTVANPPFPHSDAEPPAQADFTCLANIAGLPAISLPSGWTSDGLPLGVQIVGMAGAEAGLFRLARQLDAKLRAYRAPNQGE